MLFRTVLLEGIGAGRITLAFRRWKRPTVKAGGTLVTPVGVIRIEAVDPIDEAAISEEDAQPAGFADRRALLSQLARGPAGQVYRIRLSLEGVDPRIALRKEDALDDADRAAISRRLSGLDRTTSWSLAAMRWIAGNPGRPAGELAAHLGMEKLAAKRRIRSLKALGLTESLNVGYRLSPRGKSFLNDHQVPISSIVELPKI